MDEDTPAPSDAVLEAENYLSERAANADVKKFRRAMSKVANGQPNDEDAL